MPSKLQMYTELSETVVTRLTGSYQEWTAFLCTAGRLYNESRKEGNHERPYG